MKKYFDKYRIAGIVIFILFILCILTVTLIHINPGYEHMVPAVNSFAILEPASVDEDVISGYAGVRRTYTLKLPESIYSQGRIWCFLRHTYSTFYLEDSTRADMPVESDTPHIGHTPGHYWMSVPIYPSFAGEEIHIALTPVYTQVMNEQPVFYLADRDTMINTIILPRDLRMLVLCMVDSAIGLFLFLFSLIPELSADNRRNLFYMGLTAICVGLWKLSSLPFIILILDNMGIQKELWYTGTLCYLIMLVLSLRLQISLRYDKGNRITKLCFYISSLTAIFVILLQLTGLVELHSVLIWYGFCMALLHLISLFGKKPSKAEVLWLIPFFVALGLDFLICLFTGTLRGAPFLLLWIPLNLLIRGFGFVKNDLEQERQLRIKEIELKDSRIRAMMNEIRPHFIHNTLTSIYILCEEDPKLAQKVIGDFTTYLQANFQAISSTELTSFSRELEHTKAYVAVESILYEGKLSIEYDIEYSAFRLPTLTLQPIVENAIKYTVGRGQAKSHITVRTRSENGNAVIRIQDDGKGFSASPVEAEGGNDIHVGLNNVRERLKMMCDGQLTITPAETGGSVITIIIPPSHPGTNEYSGALY